MLDQESGSLNRIDLSLLHVCDNPVAWSLSKAPNNESCTSPWYLAGFLQFVSQLKNLVPHQCKQRTSVLSQLDASHFVQVYGRPGTF